MKLDLTKYIGHAPTPWRITEIIKGSITLCHGVQQIPMCRADRDLIQDAPLLLAEVKELKARIEKAPATFERWLIFTQHNEPSHGGLGTTECRAWSNFTLWMSGRHAATPDDIAHYQSYGYRAVKVRVTVEDES